jgi:hypothetical protein
MQMPSAGALFVEVIPDLKGFAPKMQAETTAASRGLSGVFSKMGLVLGGLLAAGLVKKSLSAFDDVEKATKRLQIGLGDIGQGAQLQGLTDWATGFARQTGILVKDVEDFSGKLLNMGAEFFRNEGPKAVSVLEDMTTALEGMSVETGKSAQMLMRSLGPAILNVPDKALPLLQKYGALTADQVVHVKALADAGKNQAASEQIILDLTKRYGDAARRAATPESKFAEAMNELEIAIGAVATKALPAITSGLRDLLPVLGFAASHLPELVAGFLAFKTLSFVPSILLSIGLGLEKIGLTGAASSIGNVAGSIQGLGRVAKLAGAFVVGLAVEGLLTLAHDADLAAEDVKTFAKEVGDGTLTIAQYQALIAATAKETGGWIGQDIKATFTTKALKEEMAKEQRILDAVAQATHNTAAGHNAAADATDRLAAAQRRVTAAAKAEYASELSLAGGLLGIEGDALSAAQASQDLVTAREHVNKLADKGKQGTEAYKQALADEKQAALGAAQAHLQLTSDTRQFVIDQHKAGTATSDIIKQLNTQARAAGLTKGEIATLDSDVKGYIATLGHVPDSVRTKIEADTGAANAAIAALVAKWNNTRVYLDVVMNPDTSLHGGHQRRRQHGGPVMADTPYIVGEAGPELFVSNRPGRIEPRAHAGVRGHGSPGGAMRIEGTLEIPGLGEARIRGWAREETRDELAYRGVR